METVTELAVPVLTGIGLAACAGLRAFLPLFIIGLAVRMGWTLPASGAALAWLSTTTSLTAFGTASVIEILADKVPALDHALDAVATFVRPLAGTGVFLAVCPTQDPLLGYALAVIAGGGAAGLLHIKKSAARVASSAATLGLGNPMISLLEDVLCVAGAVAALLAPLLLLCLLLAGLLVLSLLIRRLLRKQGERTC